MKLRIASMAKATLMILIFTGLAFWMKDASHSFIPAVGAPQVTEVTKFSKAMKWIPNETEFFLALDVDRALANEKLKKCLEEFAANNNGAVGDLVRSMLGKNGLLEMIVVLGDLGEGFDHPEVLAIAQGDFANNNFVADLKKVLNEAGSEIEELQVAGRTVISETSAESFGIAELDDEHIMVGERGLLSSYLERANGKPSLGEREFSKAPLFGRLIVGKRFAKLAPEDLSMVKEIEFVSPDGGTIYADMPCKDSTEALKLKVFLVGARSVLLIRAEGNESLKRIIEGVTIGGSGSNVLLSINLSTLLDMW